MTQKTKTIFRLLGLGTLLAGVLWALQGPPGEAETLPEILVSEAEVAHLQARWMRQWNRPPTRGELKGAMDAFVREEILYREALDRGLDREDPTVRLAMVRKMQLLAGMRGETQEMAEEDLAAFFALRKERYREPARLSLAQLFFRTDNDPASALAKAEKTLEQVRREDPTPEELMKLGDSLMLETFHRNLTSPEVERLFGTEFAASVLPLEENTWSGPVTSGYGLHLVRVFDRVPSRLPALDEVREKVIDDLRYENRKAAEEQGYLEVAGKYRVVITDEAARRLEGEGGQ